MCWLGASAPSTDAGLINEAPNASGPAWISWRRLGFFIAIPLSCGLVKSIDSKPGFPIWPPGLVHHTPGRFFWWQFLSRISVYNGVGVVKTH
jgi:hypothetical protein